MLDTNLFADFDWLTAAECQQRIRDDQWRSVRRGLLAENLDEKLLNLVNAKLNEKKMEMANS